MDSPFVFPRNPVPTSMVATYPSPALVVEVRGNQGVQQARSMIDAPAVEKTLETGSKRTQHSKWSEEERSAHKTACRGKMKLTIGEKIDIVRRHEATDPAEKQNQVQLAELFGKSRSAISKILQPDSVRKLKEMVNAGVSTSVKFFTPAHPELEKKIKQWVDGQLSNGTHDFKRDGASLYLITC